MLFRSLEVFAQELGDITEEVNVEIKVEEEEVILLDDKPKYDEDMDYEGVLPAKGRMAEKIKNGDIHLVDIPLVIIKLIDIVTKLAGTIAVLFLLYGGFQLAISGISEDKEGARNTIKWAIIGLVISFLAWVIIYVVQAQLTI